MFRHNEALLKRLGIIIAFEGDGGGEGAEAEAMVVVLQEEQEEKVVELRTELMAKEVLAAGQQVILADLQEKVV